MISYRYGKPRFCRVCGLRLVERDDRRTEFDEYTGNAVKVGDILLECPNFSLTPEGLTHTSRRWTETYPPMWERTLPSPTQPLVIEECW